ncbi:hypothetical protein B0H13DRAFT_1852546 [Mycena leptocephala]|nr:hypothetical protein B0H13DRAFT_1852546 [Mycena leptocephala]
MSEERKRRNRISAQASRDRRKAQLLHLERQVTELEEMNGKLRAGLAEATLQLDYLTKSSAAEGRSGTPVGREIPLETHLEFDSTSEDKVYALRDLKLLRRSKEWMRYGMQKFQPVPRRCRLPVSHPLHRYHRTLPPIVKHGAEFLRCPGGAAKRKNHPMRLGICVVVWLSGKDSEGDGIRG